MGKSARRQAAHQHRGIQPMGTERNHRGVKAASTTTIEISFQYQGDQCRERIKLQPTPPNLARASRHRAAIISAIESGTFDYRTTFPNSTRAQRYSPDSILLADYLKTWWRTERPELKASTAANDQLIIHNQIIPALGHILLNELTWPPIRDWIRANQWATKTQNNKLSVLRRALNSAVEDSLIEHNPMAGKIIRNRKARKPGQADAIQPFDHQERQAIITTATGQLKNLITFGFWTGLRLSEIFAVNWSNIDWVNQRIYIDAALTRAAKDLESTKTEAGERTVDLLPDAIAALQSQKAHTWLQGDAIFLNPNTHQRWQSDKTLRSRSWTTLLKRAGVRYRPPKQMRHTYASMMLMAGESPQWVATQMGHRDWTFTARTYYRWIPKDDQGSGHKAAEKWGQSKAEKKA